MEGVYILLGALAVLFGIVVWTFVSYHNHLKSGKGLIDEVPPMLETYATILGKHVVMEKAGTKMPSHRVSYVVNFRFDDGKETAMNVPQEIFDDLPVGSRDILITQNKDFVDFGYRRGEDITNDSGNKNL